MKKYIEIRWGIDDINTQAIKSGWFFTDKQAMEILENIKRHHDCNYGITWEHLDYEIADYVENHKTIDFAIVKQEFEVEGFWNENGEEMSGTIALLPKNFDRLYQTDDIPNDDNYIFYVYSKKELKLLKSKETTTANFYITTINAL